MVAKSKRHTPTISGLTCLFPNATLSSLNGGSASWGLPTVRDLPQGDQGASQRRSRPSKLKSPPSKPPKAAVITIPMTMATWKDTALTEDEAWEYRGANKTRKPTTKGWQLLVEWKDGSSSWMKLKDIKDSNPIEVADTVCDNAGVVKNVSVPESVLHISAIMRLTITSFVKPSPRRLWSSGRKMEIRISQICLPRF